jgi:pimeloyl-ACP methyl ester carboxylesterase
VRKESLNMFVEKTVKSLHPGGFHPLVYSEFPGDPARTVVCVHGLSRNGRDFDWLAKALSEDGYRVICPDMPGRGRSPAFENPAHYNYPQYIADIVALLAHIQADKVDWIGTSMGGLIGMMVANQKDHPIKRMIINDIGPFVPATALQRIKTYVSLNPTYTTWDSYFAAFKKRMVTFAPETEDEWLNFAKISTRQDEEGNFAMDYDVRVAFGLESAGHVTDLDLWPLWPQVNMPLLLLRGETSDVLPAEVLEQMLIGKKAEAVTFPNIGHAPMMMNEKQIAIVRDWLKRT